MQTDTNTIAKEKIRINETVDGVALSSSVRGQKVKPTKRKADPYIWGIYLIILIFSVIELFSASSSEVSSTNVYSPLIRHVIFLALGFGIILWFQNIHYYVFKRLAWTFAIFSLILLVISTFMGAEYNGASRAILVGGMTIQPPEIVKLSVVVLLSSILGVNQRPGGVSNKGVIMSTLVVTLFGALLWKNGLTNTILLMSISISMFLIGGIQWSKLGMIALFYGAACGCLYLTKYSDSGSKEFDEVEKVALAQASSNGQPGVISSDKKEVDRTGTHKGRIQRYLDGVHPDDKIDDLNRQVIFSKFAQAHGGVFGQGPGNSRESARLPLAFSDYIYSIIIEDTGLIGGGFLLILYLWLLGRAGSIAYKCSRAIPAFLILGCAVMIVFQALIHMAIVTGLFPVSGQPLPLISKGGTSILVMSAAIGIMLSVSRFAVTSGNKEEIKNELSQLPEDMQAGNFSDYQSSNPK